MGLSNKEVAAFEEYFYHIMAARGSGEHALRHLLAPFARAKHPLEGRLQDIKVLLHTFRNWSSLARCTCPVAAGRLSVTC